MRTTKTQRTQRSTITIVGPSVAYLPEGDPEEGMQPNFI